MGMYEKIEDAHYWNESHRKKVHGEGDEIRYLKRLLSPTYINYIFEKDPQVVFKYVSGARGKTALGYLMRYVNRTAEYMKDEIPVIGEDEMGNKISPELATKIIDEWQKDFTKIEVYKKQSWKNDLLIEMEHVRSKLKFKSIKGELLAEEQKHYEELNSRIKGQFHINKEGKKQDLTINCPPDTKHFIVSIGGKHQNNHQAQKAIRKILSNELAERGFRYVYFEHNDSQHLHYHVVVKNSNEVEKGKRFSLDRADLFSIRNRMAKELRVHGIKRQSTLRKDRADVLEMVTKRKEDLFVRHDWFASKIEKEAAINTLKFRFSSILEVDRIKDIIDKRLRSLRIKDSEKSTLKDDRKALVEYRKNLLNVEPEQIDREHPLIIKQLSMETQTCIEKADDFLKGSKGSYGIDDSETRKDKQLQHKRFLKQHEKSIKQAQKELKLLMRGMTDKTAMLEVKNTIKKLDKLRGITKGKELSL